MTNTPYQIYNAVSFDDNSLSFIVEGIIPNKSLVFTFLKNKDEKIIKGCSIKLNSISHYEEPINLALMFKEKLGIEITGFMLDVFITETFKKFIPLLGEDIEEFYKI